MDNPKRKIKLWFELYTPWMNAFIVYLNKTVNWCIFLCHACQEWVIRNSLNCGFMDLHSFSSYIAFYNVVIFRLMKGFCGFGMKVWFLSSLTAYIHWRESALHVNRSVFNLWIIIVNCIWWSLTMWIQVLRPKKALVLCFLYVTVNWYGSLYGFLVLAWTWHVNQGPDLFGRSIWSCSHWRCLTHLASYW